MAKRSNKVSDLVTGGVPYKPSREDVEREKRYRAQSNLETLTRAQEIAKTPTLMKEVRQYAQEQMKTLQTVTKRK